MLFLIQHSVDGIFLFLKNIENSSFFVLHFVVSFVTFVDSLNFMSSSSSSSSKKGSLIGGANFLVQD